MYHEMPRDQPDNGREAIKEFFAHVFARTKQVPWELVNVAAAGNIVMTERVDNFIINERHVSVPVMSTFELGDGKIASVRDYYDLRKAEQQIRGDGG
ncbi:MAG: limonene-1,2-epoxide hydrolase family protein [Dehalococcoidia bacterium]